MTQDPAGAAPSTAHTDHVNAAAPTRPLVALSVNTGANGGRARSRARLVRELLDVGGVDVVEVLGATPQESIARAREILGLDPGRSAGPAGNRGANHAPDPTAGPASGGTGPASGTDDPARAGPLPRRPGNRRPVPAALVVAGGDGAVHVGLQAVAGTPVPLGIVPIGSGNDIAREFGMTSGGVRGAVGAILHALRAPGAEVVAGRRAAEGHLLEIDAVEVTRPGDGGEHVAWYAAILSAGVDAAVNARTNELTWPPGGTRYVRALGELLRHLEPYGYRVTMDGMTRERSALLVAVANTRYLGGGMLMAPRARVDDGRLDVVLVDPVTRVTLARVFPRIYRGTHTSFHAVHTYRARTVTIEHAPALGAEPPVAMADGEPIAALPLTLTVRPGALRVVARRVGS